MNIPDYDKALYYTMSGEWDDLLVLMIRTDDDLLSKKIHKFLNAYHYSTNQENIIESHDNLLYYVDHAIKNIPITAVEI